jgi:hypothetical protein
MAEWMKGTGILVFSGLQLGLLHTSASALLLLLCPTLSTSKAQEIGRNVVLVDFTRYRTRTERN